MENKNSFQYTYSAKEQEEIKRIRKRYLSPDAREDKLAQLRRLDAAVSSGATTAALVIGILGTLLMGSGMSLIMTPIGKALGSFLAMVIGLILGLVGMGLVALAYPVYRRRLEKGRKKIAPEILRLTDELLR